MSKQEELLVKDALNEILRRHDHEADAQAADIKLITDIVTEAYLEGARDTGRIFRMSPDPRSSYRNLIESVRHE